MRRMIVASVALAGAAMGCLDSGASDPNLHGMPSTPDLNVPTTLTSFNGTWKGTVSQVVVDGFAGFDQVTLPHELTVAFDADGLPEDVPVWPLAQIWFAGQDPLHDVGDVRRYAQGGNGWFRQADVTVMQADYSADSALILLLSDWGESQGWGDTSGEATITISFAREAGGLRYVREVNSTQTVQLHENGSMPPPITTNSALLESGLLTIQ